MGLWKYLFKSHVTHTSQLTEILVYLSLLRSLLILSSPCCSDCEPTRKPERCMWCISGHFRRCLPVSLMQGLSSSRLIGMLQAELTPPLNLLSKPPAPAPRGELHHHCQTTVPSDSQTILHPYPDYHGKHHARNVDPDANCR